MQFCPPGNPGRAVVLIYCFVYLRLNPTICATDLQCECRGVHCTPEKCCEFAGSLNISGGLSARATTGRPYNRRYTKQ